MITSSCKHCRKQYKRIWWAESIASRSSNEDEEQNPLQLSAQMKTASCRHFQQYVKGTWWGANVVNSSLKTLEMSRTHCK
jgi:hypothetical protein